MAKPMTSFQQTALLLGESENYVRRVCNANNISGIVALDTAVIHKVRNLANLGCALCVNKNVCAKAPTFRRMLRKIGPVDEHSLAKVKDFQEDDFYHAVQNSV